MNSHIAVAIVCLLSICCSICFSFVKVSGMDRISLYDEVAKVKETPGVYLIDIREAKEIEETGLIPGSIHVPMNLVVSELTQLSSEDFRKKYGVKIPDLNSPIILTCRSGRRAEISLNDLEKVGFTNGKYYAGSWLEWEQKQGIK